MWSPRSLKMAHLLSGIVPSFRQTPNCLVTGFFYLLSHLLSDSDHWRLFASKGSSHLAFVWLKQGIMDLASTAGPGAWVPMQGRCVWGLSGFRCGWPLCSTGRSVQRLFGLEAMSSCGLLWVMVVGCRISWASEIGRNKMNDSWNIRCPWVTFRVWW